MWLNRPLVLSFHTAFSFIHNLWDQYSKISSELGSRSSSRTQKYSFGELLI